VGSDEGWGGRGHGRDDERRRLVTADLDRLDLELRSVPGVVAVGLEGVDGGQLVVQVVALAALAPPDLRERVRKAVEICPEPVSLEFLVEAPPRN
jgi:hypothetical protein